MGDVCPACGVVVVPGYVKCPRCHQPLPSRRGRAGGEPSGTALASQSRRFPVGALVIAVAIAAGVVSLFALRRSDRKPEPAAEPTPVTAVDPGIAANRPVSASPPAQPAEP